MKAVRLTLPYPPSANRYWRHDRGVTHLSAEAKRYRYLVGTAAVAGRVRPLAGDVAVTLDLFRPAKRGDLDNTLKVLLDALRGHAYADDKQITDIRARRHDDKKNPRVELVVCPAATNDPRPAATGRDLTAPQ